MNLFGVWLPGEQQDRCITFQFNIGLEPNQCCYFVGSLSIPENYAQTDWKLYETSVLLFDPAIYAKLENPELPKLIFPKNSINLSDYKFQQFMPRETGRMKVEDAVNWLLHATKKRCEELFLEEIDFVLLNKFEVPPHLNAIQRCWKGFTSLFH